MRKLLLIIILFLTVEYGYSSQISIDEIDSILIEKVDYIESILELRRISPADLIAYNKSTTNELSKCKINNALCWIYFKSKPLKAMEYAKVQKSLAEKLMVEDALIASYDNMAWLYRGINDNENAILYMLKALKTKEEINDTAGIVVSLSGLAGIYLNVNNFDLAYDYFNQSLKIEESRNDNSDEGKRRLAVITGNLGLCHTQKGEIDKGLEMYFKTIELYIQSGLEHESSTTYGNIGLIYLNNKKDYSKALEYLLKAMEYHELDEDVSKQSGVYAALSEVYSLQGDFTKALIYGKKAVKFAGLSGDKQDVMSSNRTLATIFYSNRNYQMAYDHFKVAFEMKDSIFDETSSEQIAEMQTKYDTEKKEAENSLLLAEKELDRAEIDKKSTQQKMLMLGLGLTLLIVVYIAYSLNQKKKTNKLLNAQNEEISSKNEIIEEKNKDITDSINYAQRIQNAILPLDGLLKKHFDSFIYYRPKDIVSGDFYWIKEVGDKIYFSVVDCTGHGVPGAFMSIIGHNSLNRIIDDFKLTDTGLILDKLNELVTEVVANKSADEMDIRDGMDISICCIDKSTNTLQYSGANNSLYLLRKPENKLDGSDSILENEGTKFYEVKPNKMAIGGGDNNKKYETHQLQLEEKDTVYLFSDGYADQFGGPKGKKFMYKSFKRMFLSIQEENLDEQLSIIDKTLVDWKGDIEQLDDICVMGVRV